MHYFKKLLNSCMHGQLSKIDDLYQRHLGQECYIFGDGISLKWMDLKQFADRPSILGNMMICHKDVSVLKALYCSIIDSFWFWTFCPFGDGKNFYHTIHREYRKSINQNPATLFFINYSNYPVARFANAIYVSRHYVPAFEHSNPFWDREDAHYGTLRFQLALAIFCGFRKAYLVGHDYTHLPSRSLHFYEKGEGILLGGKKNFCREYLQYVNKHINLVTVTLDAVSDTLDSITYRELTGQEPQFHENTELVDKEKLLSLATWKGYSIF
jgi:hypothetical protein